MREREQERTYSANEVASGSYHKVHPGPDGKVRVVTLRTAKGIYTRPAIKIVPLVYKDNLLHTCCTCIRVWIIVCKPFGLAGGMFAHESSNL